MPGARGLQCLAVDTVFATSVTLGSRVRVPAAHPGASLVIALHGWGMTERAFERWLRPGIAARPHSWWLPRAILPCEISGRRIGYAWYVFDGDQEALRASMDEGRAYLLGLADLARRALRPSSITLLGFSQGAYLASYTALTRPALFDRLVICCGRPKSEFVDDLPAARRLKILLQTGSEDAGMPREVLERGLEPLRRAGVAVEERSYPTGHRMVPEMAREAAEFAG